MLNQRPHATGWNFSEAPTQARTEPSRSQPPDALTLEGMWVEDATTDYAAFVKKAELSALRAGDELRRSALKRRRPLH